MQRITLNKPVLGIDQLSDEINLLHNSEKKVTAVREAVNVDIDVQGNVNRREGFTLALAGSGYHSLYSASRGWLFACKSGQLGVFNPTSGVFTALTNMSTTYLTSFTELNGTVYFMNPGHMGMIRDSETFVRTLGVSLPDVTPTFAVTSNGGFAAGTYAISFSVVNAIGEESPLGPLVTLELAEGQAILGSLFTIVPGYKYRVYMTSTDGTELYQVAEFDADVTNYLLDKFTEGRRPATQYLSRLPFGYIIRSHGSRLYIATTDFVYFSEPFLPHLTNSAHNFLPTTGFTSLLQSVDGGIFIGDQNGVKFYAGDDPGDFKPQDVSTEVPIFGTGISVPGSFLPEKYASKDVSAIWLTKSGYHIGLPSGEVVRLHAEQVSLPQYVQGCTALFNKDGRKQLITPVNSNVLADASVALDSTIG